MSQVVYVQIKARLVTIIICSVGKLSSKKLPTK